MFTIVQNILAGFTSPIEIGTTPASMLGLLPFSASIAIVYKAMNVTDITFFNFTKHVVILFVTIVVFMVIAALGLLGVNWLVFE